MNWLYLLIAVLGIGLILLAVVAVRAARRLDRLHKQIAHSRRQLDRALLQRAHAATELAYGLDPAAALVLTTAASAALRAPGALGLDQLDTVETRNDSGHSRARLTGEELAVAVQQRWDRESELTEVLDALLTPEFRQELALLPGGDQRLVDLDEAIARVRFTRTFHNTHVASARSLRQRHRVLRWLVTGWTAPAQTIDFVD